MSRVLNQGSRVVRPAVTPGPGYLDWAEAEVYAVADPLPINTTDITPPTLENWLAGV